MLTDLNEIKRLMQNSGDLTAYIKDFLANKCKPNDPPFLSDLIVGFNSGGVHMMQALEKLYHDERDTPAEQRFFWKLHVISDEWGNPGRPGDTVKFKVQQPLQHAKHKPVTSGELSMDKLNGVYDEKWTKTYEYVIDEKGCISCEFMHAARFLTIWGLHARGGGIISIHKKPHSAGPEVTPDPDQKLHVHYWRYKEADKDYYAKLPVISPPFEKKRGEKGRH